MDYADAFKAQFDEPPNYIATDLDLNKKLQDTRTALQESLSEVDALTRLIEQMYSESRVEQVATGEILTEIGQTLFRNIPLPRNADTISLSEKAGYTAFYMKFLGYATRKTLGEYHVTKGHLESLHSSVKKSTVEEIKMIRTGELKVPDLDGQKEMKRSAKTTAPLSPPATPPEKTPRSKK